MTSLFQFVMRAGPTPGKAFPLEGAEIIIGRDPTCTICINDAQVSRQHARLTLSGTGYLLQDLGSTNGTFVNGQRVTGEHPLSAGELVALGENVVLTYEAAFDPNATMVAPSGRGAKPVAVAVPPPVAPGPAPAYAGQVPAGPEIAAEPKKKSKAWLIILLVLVALICSCAGALFLIDQLRLWCTFFPFLFPNAC